MDARFWLGATLLSALAFTGGCATAPPVQELSDARQAIMAAEDAGADQYASSRLTEAQSLLHRAQEKLHDRDYRGARLDAVSAHSHAIEARVIAHASISDRLN